MYETKHKYFQKLFIRCTFYLVGEVRLPDVCNYTNTLYNKSNADVNCVVVSFMSVYIYSDVLP
jgi:hypothetical protein